MPLLILALFIGVPLAEIAVFIKVGEIIGIAWTIILVIVTAIAGTVLLRMQGFAVLTRAQQALGEGRIPVDSVVDGVCLLVAGAFLLTPGLITDAAGFLLFVPLVRRGIARWVFRRMTRSGEFSASVFTETRRGGDTRRRPSSSKRPGDGPVIDGEYQRVDENGQNDGENDSHRPGDKPDADRDTPWRGPR